MRKFEIIVAITPAELRVIAEQLEQRNETSNAPCVRLNWYHTQVVFVNPESPDVKAQIDAPYNETPLIPQMIVEEMRLHPKLGKRGD